MCLSARQSPVTRFTNKADGSAGKNALNVELITLAPSPRRGPGRGPTAKRKHRAGAERGFHCPRGVLMRNDKKHLPNRVVGRSDQIRSEAGKTLPGTE